MDNGKPLPASVFRALTDLAPRALWILDVDGRTVYASRLAYVAAGLDPATASMPALRDLVDEGGRLRIAQRLELVRKGADVTSHVDEEMELTGVDGTTIWTIMRITQVRVEGTAYVIFDFGLPPLEGPLADAERIARIGRWRMDLRTQRVIGSPALEELSDHEPGTFPMGMLEFLDHLHADDREAATDAMIELSAGRTEDLEIDVRIRGRSGWRWARIRAIAHRNRDGKVVEISGTDQEITDQKLVELALRESANLNALLHTFASAANTATTVDDLMTSTRALIAEHPDWQRIDLIRLDDGQPRLVGTGEAPRPVSGANALTLATAALEARGQVWDARGRRIGAPVYAGERVWGALVLTPRPPVRSAALVEQFAEQVALQFRRVAEREASAAEITAARDAATEASALKSAFLATMSHEIRTPLNGVLGMTELLLGTDLDPHQRELATNARAAGRMLLTLVNDVLDQSKLEAGRLDLEQVPVDVREVVDEASRLVTAAATSKGITLTTTVAGAVPALVTTDPVRLAQIMTNLLSNAVKFTSDGHVDLTVELVGSTLSVSAADTGIGVPPDRVPTLFQPFVQADSATARLYGGSGLGLAIVRELAEAMGGAASYSPRGGGGSVFRVDIEVGIDPSADPVATVPVLPATAGARVLLVEDVHVNQLVGRGLLTSIGCVIDSARDGEEAVALAGGSAYDVILMDLQMPGIDGFEATRRIRSSIGPNGGTPIVATSATAQETTQDRCREAGIDDYLAKPLTAGRLAEVVGRWRGRHHGDLPGPGAVDLDRLTLLADPTEVGPGYLTRAIAGLTERAPDAVAQLHAALAGGRLSEVASSAHRLAGSALNLGLREAGELLQRLEIAAASDAPETGSLLTRADAALQCGLALLAEHEQRAPGRVVLAPQ